MSRRIASSESRIVSQAERDIRSRLDSHSLNFTAMSAVSNVYRTASTVRNYMERTLLSEYELSWVAFTILWVLWIWGAQETGHVAAEAGVTKGTLTGVMKTLHARKLIRRLPHRDDRRRVSITLSRAGERLIEELFPRFNEQEARCVGDLSTAEQQELARLLRLVNRRVGELDGPSATH